MTPLRTLRLGERTVHLGWCAVDDASPQALSPAESELAERGKTDKRRREFAAGRIAARRAVEATGVTGPFDLLATETGVDAGRPYVARGTRGEASVALSISHASGWAVAAAAAGAPLGLDLEVAEFSADDAFDREAFADKELERWSLPQELAPRRRAIAWAAKEAVLKVWGVGLRAPLGLVSLSPSALKRTGDVWSLALALERSAPTLDGLPRRLRAVLLSLDEVVLCLAEAC